MKRTILLTVVFAFCGSCDWSEPEVHLIPAGYVGTIYIVHNRPDGTPLKREGRARIYEIPTDGVLWSQSPTNLGWFRPTQHKYYTSALTVNDNRSHIGTDLLTQMCLMMSLLSL